MKKGESRCTRMPVPLQLPAADALTFLSLLACVRYVGILYQHGTLLRSRAMCGLEGGREGDTEGVREKNCFILLLRRRALLSCIKDHI